jgi:hypothetical protein
MASRKIIKAILASLINRKRMKKGISRKRPMVILFGRFIMQAPSLRLQAASLLWPVACSL